MKAQNTIKTFLTIACFMMALGVLMGAFGTHALKSILDNNLLEIYHTGVQYQFYNSLGLFATSFIIYLKPQSKKVLISFWFIFIGTIIFSFSLYLLAILNIPDLGAITPIGGVSQVIGWLLLAFGICKD